MLILNFSHFPFQLVQLLSRVQLFATPWTAACQAFLSITNSRSLLKLTSIESVMPSNNLFFLLPSIFPSIRVFSSESVLCIRWPKYLSFSFSISPSSEYSGLISLGGKTSLLEGKSSENLQLDQLRHNSTTANWLLLVNHPGAFQVLYLQKN